MALVKDSKSSIAVKVEPLNRTFPICLKSQHGLTIGLTTIEALETARDLITAAGGVDKDTAVQFVGEAVDKLIHINDDAEAT